MDCDKVVVFEKGMVYFVLIYYLDLFFERWKVLKVIGI